MSSLNKKYKEMNETVSNSNNNSIDKDKLNIIPNLKGIQNINQKELNSTFITQQTNKQKKNRKVFFQGIDNGKTMTKFILKNSLTPINNKLYFHKISSMPKLIQKNKNKILNVTPKKSILKKIGKKMNQSLSNENIIEKPHNIDKHNISGFNSTKNYLNISNNRFFQTKKDSENDKSQKRYFSKFFYKSQNKNITSKRIYHHYIKEEERDKVEPIKPFLRGGVPRSIKELKNLYKDNAKFQRRLNELKFNRTIAFKDDFNVLEYQSTLIKLLYKRISLKNLYDLQKEFIVFNEKNFGFVGPKGRFTNMAEKIKYNIPFYLYEKIRQLDTDKLISRYNYYKRVNERISNNIRKKYELKKKQKKNDKSREREDNSIGI